MSKRYMVLAGSVALVATPLAWYGYQLYRGKSPHQIHEERIHTGTGVKETNKPPNNMVNFYNGNQEEASWRSWLDWDMDKIDDTVNKWYEEGASRFRNTFEERKKGV